MAKKRTRAWWLQYVYVIQMAIDSIDGWEDSTADTDEEHQISDDTKAAFIKYLDKLADRHMRTAMALPEEQGG